MTNNVPHGTPGTLPGTRSSTSAGSSSMPRRSSYASVVSGAASGSSQPPQSLPRSGQLAQLINQAQPVDDNGNFPHTHQNHHTRRPSRGMDVEMSNGDGGFGSRAKAVRLPRSSRKFSKLGVGYRSLYGNGPPGQSSFFIPSYLESSRYMERLAEAHRSKSTATQTGTSPQSSRPGSLSTSSSSLHLHKMPSSRVMTYDVIEREPPTDDDGLTPLPSRWSEAQKPPGIEIIADGSEVRFTGPAKTEEHNAVAVRSDHPISPQCGIYYYEVTILSKGKEGLIGIGFSSPSVPLTRLPGWEPDSWAYHGDDGRSFCCQSTGRDYGPKFSTFDVIGCAINFRTRSAFFTKNGVNLGTAFRDLKPNTVKFYPSVGMKRPHEHLRVNFGQHPFVYDIDGLMAQEKMLVQEEINAATAEGLHPPLNETAVVQALVAQFLAHEGYIETARAFSKEVAAEIEDTSQGRKSKSKGFEAKEDLEAVQRQRIRVAILEGDVDKAIKHTTAFYPSVLKDNEQIYFRLRCRKFIEMIRECAELNLTAQDANSGADVNMGSARSSEATYDDVFDHDMELDDQVQNEWGTMETEETKASKRHSTQLQDTILYGKALQQEFRHDDREEVKRALKETFSFLAYENPKDSTVSHLLDASGRIPVAEELNSAILVSLGKASSAALERLYKQTEALVGEISDEGGAGAFVNVRKDFLE